LINVTGALKVTQVKTEYSIELVAAVVHESARVPTSRGLSEADVVIATGPVE
jgi:hypothetical protein